MATDPTADLIKLEWVLLRGDRVAGLGMLTVALPPV
jgi:hypothetical protein